MGEGSYEESTVLLEDNLYIKKNLILLIYFLAAGGIRLAPHTFEPHFVPALSVTKCLLFLLFTEIKSLIKLHAVLVQHSQAYGFV